MLIGTTYHSIYGNVSEKVRFVFLSDLHNFDNSPILELIDKSNADAVLVAGDFIHNNNLFENGFEFLKYSALRLPTFCSLGNHEIYLENTIRTSVMKSGAVLLDNSFCTFKGIKIGGLTSGKFYSKNNKQPDLNWLCGFSLEEGYKLLLCHHPEYFNKYICDLSIDITLSGHAHGGQWRFFDKGIYAPGQGLFPKYTCGLYDNRLLINRGIGNQFIIPRINNKPEIIILDINKTACG